MTPKKPRDYDTAVLQLLGDPRQVDDDLQAFRKDARVLSSRRKHLVVRYPKQWMGIYGGDVVAHAKTLTSLVTQLDALGVPRGRAIVRYIDKSPRKMILYTILHAA